MSNKARERRGSAKQFASVLLYNALADHDVTQQEAANCLGVSRALIQKQCNRESDETSTLADLLLYPREVALALLRGIASRLDCDIIDAKPDEHADNHLARLHDILRETSDVVQRYSAAASDGSITPAEASEIVVETVEATSALRGLAAHCRQLIERAEAERKAASKLRGVP